MSTMKALAGLALLIGAQAQEFGKKGAAPIPKYKPVHPEKVEVPPIPYCPDGTPYDANGCLLIQFAQPYPECPHPYKLDKKTGQCVAKTYGESSFICPKGSYLHGHKCVSEITAPAEVLCKHDDAELTKDGCVRRFAPELVKDAYDEVKLYCPKGYKLESDHCVKAVKFDYEYSCPKGYILEKKKCVGYDSVPLECPKGFSIVADGCLNMEVTPPVPKCPKHTKPDGKGNCLHSIVTEPTYVCEKGYTLNKKKCEAQILLQAIPMDAKKDVHIAVPCKKGQKDDKTGNCYSVHTTHPVPVCEEGFDLIKKKCVTAITVNPEYYCPHKFEMTKSGECVRANIAKIKCPKGYKQVKGAKGSCVSKESVHPIAICPKGEESKHKCVSYDIEEPLAECKKGFEFEKGQCIKKAFAKPGKDKIEKPVFVCPKGLKLHKKSQVCVDSVSTHPLIVCEKGHEIHGKKCIAYHTITPQLMCPKKYTTGEKGCEKITYVRPFFKCPEGSEDHGKKCYIHKEPTKKM